MVSSILGKLFSTTERGAMGLAPYDVQPADEVPIMLGRDIPLVLRIVGHGLNDPEYPLLGECCLHGVMFREAMEGYDLPVIHLDLR